MSNRVPEDELLAGDAAGDLGQEKSAELLESLGQDGHRRRKEFMTAAALVQLCFLLFDDRGLQPMPAALQARILRAAQHLPSRVDRSETGARRETRWRRPSRRQRWLSLSATGWYVAAGLAVGLVTIGPEAPRPSVAIDVISRRAELLRSADDLLTVRWSPSTSAGFEKVTGDVVWSSHRQQGYLRLSGLPPNDPGRRQYQLWIVDPERDSHPVDGGIFDVVGSGEVTIAIQAKLVVERPVAFAITLEKPGGVVVSAGPLLVVAAVAGPGQSHG